MIGVPFGQTAGKLLLTGAFVAGATALQSCHRRSAEQTLHAAAAKPRAIGVQWTKEAADRTAKGGKPYALPQLRVYDARGQLVYNLPAGGNPATVGAAIDNALKSDRVVAGPTLMQSLADLQTYQGSPAVSVVAQKRPLIFDYWATWCIPCKQFEKSLLAWSAQKPAGSVQIVKAETDIMKAMRAAGQRTFMVKKDVSGKPHVTEVK